MESFIPGPETTIDEFITTNPSVVPYLASLQIDFFCRTDRTLAQACADVDIDLSELIALIASGQPAREGAR